MHAARGTRPSLAARFGAAALAALGVAPLACGAEPPTAPVFDIAAACVEYVAAYETAVLCRRADLVPPGQWQVEVPAQQLRTRRLFEERCRTWLAAPGSGITPAVLHACSARVRGHCLESFAFVEGMFVNPWRSRNVLCDLDIPGTLPDGAACGDATQCAGGWCDKGAFAGPISACGTCVSRPRVGELCEWYPCARDAQCPTCKGQGCSQGFTCVPDNPRRAEGETCTRMGECSPGLVCDLVTTGRCSLPAPPGAPCRDGSYCRFGWCEDGACPDQRGEGGRCGHSSAGCLPGLICGRWDVCVPPALVSIGETCDNSRDDVRCRDDGLCVRGTCVRRARLGEACEPGLSCEDGPFVQCIDGTCQLFDPGACR